MVEAVLGQTVLFSFLSLISAFWEYLFSLQICFWGLINIFADCLLELNPLGAIPERDKPLGFHFNKLHRFCKNRIRTPITSVLSWLWEKNIRKRFPVQWLCAPGFSLLLVFPFKVLGLRKSGETPILKSNKGRIPIYSHIFLVPFCACLFCLVFYLLVRIWKL